MMALHAKALRRGWVMLTWVLLAPLLVSVLPAGAEALRVDRTAWTNNGAPSVLPLPSHVLAASQGPFQLLPVDVTKKPGNWQGSGGAQIKAGDEDDGYGLRPALLASAGLALTGGFIAYWSTHEAEAAYDRYLHSAGTRRQQKALDRAERFDRLAGAGFLVMEAGLVLTARFVFF